MKMTRSIAGCVKRSHQSVGSYTERKRCRKKEGLESDPEEFDGKKFLPQDNLLIPKLMGFL
jgi:hypothetical protein